MTQGNNATASKPQRTLKERLRQVWADLVYIATGGPENEIKPEEDRELIGLRAHRETLNYETLVRIIADVKHLREQDEKRKDTIESKAITLIGSITLASTFIVGLSQISANSSVYTGILKALIVITYICIGLSLLITITFALRATRVGKYKFGLPGLENYWANENKGKTETEIEYSHAVTLLYTYIRNRELINHKAGHVIHSQIWFRRTVFFLFFLTMLMGLPPLLDSSQAAPTTAATPIMVIIVTSTAIDTPTATATYTPSNTATIAPSPTPTASLIPSSTQVPTTIVPATMSVSP